MRIDSLKWAMNLRKNNQDLYDKIYASYLDIIEVIIFDNFDDQDGSDAFIIGCDTIDDHVKTMLSSHDKYCRTMIL